MRRTALALLILAGAAGADTSPPSGPFDPGRLSMRVSHDGKRLVSGGADGHVRLWDPATGKFVAERAGHGGPVHALLWSRAHGLFISAGGCSVRFWRPDDGFEEAAVLHHPWPEIDGAAVSPSGRWLATTTTDGALRICGR